MADGDYRLQEFHVAGLQGEHCRRRIEQFLTQLPGVDNVAVDLMTGNVAVSYNAERIAAGYIAETLQTLGYAVQK